jgi:thioesterase domain-containing protein
MIDRIEQAYGKRLPLSTLFAEATVSHLANCLRVESVREGKSPIIPVQTEGSRAPFFYLHGDLGGGLYCRTLARLLGPDQPLYGVMPSGVDGKPFLPSVQAMAAVNIRQLLTVQTRGPYLLGGYCNGGLVAYEMAQQMRQQGLGVGMVILLDTWVPRYFGWLKAIVQKTRGLSPPDPDRRGQVYAWLRNYLVRTHSAYHQGPRALLHLYSQKAGRILRESLWTSPQGFVGHAPAADDPDPFHFRSYPEFGRIISSYRPQPYDGRIVLLRTRYLEESHPTDRTAGWGRLASQLEVHELPGDHHNCLTEHLGDVAEHIGKCLREFHEDGDGELAESSRQKAVSAKP